MLEMVGDTPGPWPVDSLAPWETTAMVMAPGWMPTHANFEGYLKIYELAPLCHPVPPTPTVVQIPEYHYFLDSLPRPIPG